MQTTDGGRDWETIVTTTAPVVQLWTVGDAAWALTACGASIPECAPRLLRSSDGGATWATTATNLAQLSFSDTRFGWGATASTYASVAALVYRTADGGVTWKAVPSPCRGSPVGPFRAIAFSSNSSGIAVCAFTIGAGGEYRSVLHTADGGATWQVRAALAPSPVPHVGSMPYGGYARGLVVAHDGTAWLWGDRMVPLASTDGGATWRPLGFGDPDALLVGPMWVLDRRRGFALAWDPNRQATMVEATTDGGRTWLERASIPVAAVPPGGPIPAASPLGFGSGAQPAR